MGEVVKIVLTGGPCAGKTTALGYIKNELEKLGVKVFTVGEQATRLMNGGISPNSVGNYEFQRLLFKNAVEEESRVLISAQKEKEEKTVILFDRGLLDGRAFVTEDEFKRYSSEFNLNEDIIRNSYDAVFHLVTCADGAKEYYGNKSNPVRTESIKQACIQDKKILALWTGTSHLRIIDNSTDFWGKLERLKTEILSFLGIPEHFEIERKFLIEYPDVEMLNRMEACRRIPITQAYLYTPQEGFFRIRRRGEGENAVFIKTVKKKISEIKRIETENYISKEEYYSYLKQSDSVTGIISKDRYCISYKGTYYELDVYPFWKDKATLEIELLSEDQEYKLPDFVTLIREVTFEQEYKNSSLAQKYRAKEVQI